MTFQCVTYVTNFPRSAILQTSNNEVRSKSFFFSFLNHHQINSSCPKRYFKNDLLLFNLKGPLCKSRLSECLPYLVYSYEWRCKCDFVYLCVSQTAVLDTLFPSAATTSRQDEEKRRRRKAGVRGGTGTKFNRPSLLLLLLLCNVISDYIQA